MIGNGTTLAELAKERLEQKDFLGYLLLHERKHRLDIFCDVLFFRFRDNGEYWKLLKSVWTDAEGNSINFDTWVILFELKRFQYRNLLMNGWEKTHLAKLPDILTVYRGGEITNALSWTLDRKVAEFFAKYRYGKRKLFTAQVAKGDIYAYFNNRKEREIVVHPKFLTNIQS